MITKVSIRCQKNPLVYAVYPRIPPNTPLIAGQVICVAFILFLLHSVHCLLLILLCVVNNFSAFTQFQLAVLCIASVQTLHLCSYCPVNQLSAGPQGCSQLTWAPRQSGSQLFWQKQGSHGSCKVLKNPENEKKSFRPLEVLKLAVGPEKILIFGQCGPEQLIWSAR